MQTSKQLHLMRSEKAGRVRMLIFLGCFVIFSASPVTVLLDSQFALLTTESCLKAVVLR